MFIVDAVGASVVDLKSYIYKADIFRKDYEEAHSLFADYFPSFNLIELAGAPLKVVGVLNRNADIAQVEDFRRNPDLFRKHFFDIFVKALKQLNPSTQTRKHNLALSSFRTNTLPTYIRVYKQDIRQLSRYLKLAFKNLPADFPYKFHYYMLQIWAAEQGEVSHLHC